MTADHLFPVQGRPGPDGYATDLPFAAWLGGVDSCGERFKLEAVLDRLTGYSLNVRLPREVSVGARVFGLVLLGVANGDARCARVALCGTVQRAELESDGRYGLVIAFQRHWFLYAPDSS